MLFTVILQEANSLSRHPAEDLLKRLATGEKDAMAELYQETRAAVYGFSLSILKNPSDAEDVLHDTYLKIYASAGSYQANGNPMAWSLTIAKNLSLMKLREESRFRDLEDYEWESAVPVDAIPVDRVLLRTALQILTSEERQVILLHALSGLKHREIARLLDLALPTVLSKYHRH